MKKQSVLFIASLFFIIQAKAQCNWQTVGLPGISTGSVTFNSIAIDNNGIPYVVYADSGDNLKATVMKFNGSNWVTVGSAGFSAAAAAWADIAIDNSGTPYVVYCDGNNNQEATVMKFDGSNWVTVGSAGFSAGTAWWTKIAIDNNGTPYVVYADGNLGGSTVMKFDGTNWLTVGSAGFGTAHPILAFTSIAIDGSGTPYMAYRELGNGNKATVMKFNGANWVTVGSPAFSAADAWWTSIAIDNNGTPYVAYRDWGNGNKATVMKFNGTNWVTVGSAGGASLWAVNFLSFAIDNNGTPYVMCGATGTFVPNATVMKFNGSIWQSLGLPGFSAGDVFENSIAIDASGVTYVVYRDGANSLKPTVMKYVPGAAITGTASVTACGSYVWQGITYTASANALTQTITSSIGCDSIVTLNLIINSLPSITVNSGSICAGDNFIITPSGADTYTISGNSFTVSPSTTTSYSVSGTNSIGCVNKAVTEVTVNALPTLSITGGGTICVNETTMLNVSGANTYTWNTNENTSNISVSPSVTTGYSVFGANNNGCVDSSSVALYVDACTGIKELGIRNDELKVYPNPTNGMLNIELGMINGEAVEIFVYDVLGNKVIHNSTFLTRNSIDLSELKSGVYFIRSSKGGSAKFVKE